MCVCGKYLTTLVGIFPTSPPLGTDQSQTRRQATNGGGGGSFRRVGSRGGHREGDRGGGRASQRAKERAQERKTHHVKRLLSRARAFGKYFSQMVTRLFDDTDGGGGGDGGGAAAAAAFDGFPLVVSPTIALSLPFFLLFLALSDWHKQPTGEVVFLHQSINHIRTFVESLSGDNLRAKDSFTQLCHVVTDFRTGA